MRLNFPDRVTIVSEGDSWFAYPPKWIINGTPSNLIDHLSSWTWRKANFMAMASNGDEALSIVSGQQKHDLIDLLRWHTKGKNRKPVDLLLFSGGGNDLVGDNDFERFLLPYKSGRSAKQCVNLTRLRRKTKQIGLALEELADIRDHFSPDTVIMTHNYDYPYASLQGAVFLGGLIKIEAWMKRFMDQPEIAIPEELQTEVVKVFMDELAAVTRKVGKKRDKLIVVETIGTLKGKKEWLDEIHPTREGFKQIATKIWFEMLKVFPQLQKKKGK